MLRQQGASVPFETWGVETAQKLRLCLPVDLILLDLALPRNISGYDVFDNLKDEPDLAQIPVVVVSAADPTVEMPIAREKGIDCYISKPLKYGSFSKTIASILAGEKIWGLE
jgi:CheY-like chemotaxis protein